jgi:DNA replication protein DnaC
MSKTTHKQQTNHPDNQLQSLLNDLGMAMPFEDISQDHTEIIASFIKDEKDHRQDIRIKNLMQGLGLKPRQIRTFEKFDWSFNPKLPKQDILSFRNSDWISNAHNLVMIGDTGVGKTHIGRALCHDAILKGEGAYFTTAYDLLARLKTLQRPDTRINHLGTCKKVLCIDELGYTQQTKEAGDFLFQIIAKRSETLPTIITTNLSPKQWGSIFAGTAAAAILDRLSYNGKFLTMTGPSYRDTKNHTK